MKTFKSSGANHVPHQYTPDSTLPCVHCGERKEAACHVEMSTLTASASRAVSPAQPEKNMTKPENWPLQSFDARDWAEAFCQIYRQTEQRDIDEGWMIAWFANALMRGFDEATRRRDVEVREFIGWLSRQFHNAPAASPSAAVSKE